MQRMRPTQQTLVPNSASQSAHYHHAADAHICVHLSCTKFCFSCTFRSRVAVGQLSTPFFCFHSFDGPTLPSRIESQPCLLLPGDSDSLSSVQHRVISQQALRDHVWIHFPALILKADFVDAQAVFPPTFFNIPSFTCVSVTCNVEEFYIFTSIVYFCVDSRNIGQQFFQPQTLLQLLFGGCFFFFLSSEWCQSSLSAWK